MEPLEDSVGFLLRKAYQRNALLFQRHSPGRQLTGPQGAVLIALFGSPPCSLTELGRRTAMDPATTRGVVERMRERGLVSVSPGTRDKRQVMVRLEEQGNELYEMLVPARLRIDEDTMGALNAAERVALVMLLKKITNGA